MKRRSFLLQSGLMAAAVVTGASACRPAMMSEEQAMNISKAPPENLFFKISLAQWSLHRSLWSGELDNLDFAKTARELGIEGLEYVNQFFFDKAKDTAYLGKMKQRAEDEGCKSLILMVDREGSLAGKQQQSRLQAVENHYKWIEAAAFLGCHSVRVNAFGKGKAEEVAQRATDSLARLCEYAAQEGLNVLVENHGGYTSDAAWLSGVIKTVGKENCGTLPDFGNFTINLFPYRQYDRYQGVRQLMPFAKGVSAKSHDFLPSGQEVKIDFGNMLQIVRQAGYRGYIGIEYEGYRLSERAGILATKALLMRGGENSRAN